MAVNNVCRLKIMLPVALCIHVVPCTCAEFCCNCSGSNCISTNKMTYCAVFSQGIPDHAKHITDLTCQGLCRKNCLFICIFICLFIYLY